MPRIESTPRPARRPLVFMALVVIVGFVGLRGTADPSTARSERRPAPRAAAGAGSWRAHVPEAPPGEEGAAEEDAEGREDDALRLEGQVIEGDDQPVGGARVTLGGGRSVVTEADGSFAFDGLAAGRYDVTAELGDAFAEAQQFELDATSDPVTLSLVRGPTLVVHVVDDRGQPVAGATVEAAWRSVVTAADGTARFRGVGTGSEYVDVRAADHAHVRQRVETGDDPAATIECTVALAAGSELSGTVVDLAGRRVPDAYVELIAGKHLAGDETVFADETGTWRMTNVGTGTYVLRASSKVHTSTDDLVLAHDGRHATTGVVVRVEPGGEIAGVVVDAAGRPLEGAQVRVEHNVETSDARGEVVVRGLAPATYNVSANTATHGAASQRVTIERGQRAQVRFELAPASLAGVVVSRTGEPMEDALVFARSSELHSFTIERSDAYGRFDFGGLAPGRYVLTAQRRDSQIEGPAVEVTPPSRHLALVVPELARVTFRVVLDGAPVAHYRVVLTDDPASEHGRAIAVHEATGRFTERDATPGTLAVVITGPGLARRVVSPVEVVAGRTVDLGDLAVSRDR